MRSALLAGLIAVSVPALAAVGDPKERRDISDKLQTVLCSGNPDLTARKTLALGLHDAQIDARIVESIAGNTVSARILAKKAKALAAMKHFHGYAHGVCSDRKGWVAAIPAPVPMTQSPDGFSVNTEALKSGCRTFRADYAALASGVSVKLASGGRIDTRKLAPGMIEVTCQPAFPRWMGPVMWYLAPTGDQFAADQTAVPAGTTTDQQLASWIAARRKAGNLTPLVANDNLTSAAELLTIDTSVTHNRANTDGLRAKIKSSANLHVLGELRVRGQSVEDLAWMLWHSPRHRDLILSPDATSIGLHVKAVGTEFLAVVLSGQEARPVTAARAKKNPVK
jgi:hypothetical protein